MVFGEFFVPPPVADKVLQQKNKTDYQKQVVDNSGPADTPVEIGQTKIQPRRYLNQHPQ